MTMQRKLLIIGAMWSLVGVALGAFGAHGLAQILAENDRVEVWKTAVNYQMWHALALMIFACAANETTRSRAIPVFLNLGILLFSGSLYWIALGGPKWLGPITPIGGTCFIIAWSTFIWCQLRQTQE